MFAPFKPSAIEALNLSFSGGSRAGGCHHRASGFRQGPYPARSRVLVDGSGGVGIFAVQIANRFGAITAVAAPEICSRPRFLGADHVIDYTVSDFTRSGQRTT